MLIATFVISFPFAEKQVGLICVIPDFVSTSCLAMSSDSKATLVFLYASVSALPTHTPKPESSTGPQIPDTSMHPESGALLYLILL